MPRPGQPEAEQLMAPALPARYRPPTRDRAVSATLAGAIVALMLLAIVWIGFRPPPVPRPRSIVAISIPGGSKGQQGSKHEAPKAPEKARSSSTAVAVAPRRIPIKYKQTVVSPPPADLPFIQMSSNDLRAGNIGSIHSAGGGGGGGGGAGRNAAYGPGLGEGGAQLIPATWVREPTHAELAPYLPDNGVPAGSSVTLACRTIEHFHVENCETLSENPPGMGLGKGMRRASWQFLVRPLHHSNDTSLAGQMIYITFTFHDRKDKESDESAGD